MFDNPEIQIARVKAWNKKYGWGFTKKDFGSLTLDPQNYPKGLTTYVLVPYLKSTQSTFDGLWEVIENEYNTRKWKEIDKVKLFKGKHQKGLRWELIDLGANHAPEKGRTVQEVRAKGEDLAHAGVLAAVAHFPDWVHAMDGKTVPYVDLGGYKTTFPGDSEPYALCVYWDPFNREAELSASWLGIRSNEWAAPVRRESLELAPLDAGVLGTPDLGNLKIEAVIINGNKYVLEER